MPWNGARWEPPEHSLGYEVVTWIEEHCCYGPGDLQGERAHVDLEMARFIVDGYEVDSNGRRVFDESVLSRPKGRAKTEVAGWLVCAEAFSDKVRFSHWDKDGEPVGKAVTSPLIKCLATEESQATAAFSVVAFIVDHWGKEHHPAIYEGVTGARAYQSATNLYLPRGGEIRACSSGAASKDGGKETFVVCDESHLYVLPELRRMYATIRRNLGKRKLAEPWMLQTTTAYQPGEQSIAEETMTAWRKGELSSSVHVDHREAKGAVNIRDEDHTKKQLVYVYGEAAEWMDVDRIYREMLDPRSCPDDATAARYYLNRAMSTKNVWIAKDIHERQTKFEVVEFGEPIALGFDGSLNDDTTVLRGCRMSDGFLFKIGAWAKPEGAAGIGWQVPRREVLDVIREAHSRYKVVRGFYDPHEWVSDIENLADELDPRDPRGQKIKGRECVLPWRTNRDTAMGMALDRLHADLMNGVVFHDDDPLAAEHYGNCYVTMRHGQRLVRKEYPNSPRKIDSVVGDALAYEARAQAIADGWDQQPSGPKRARGRTRAY